MDILYSSPWTPVEWIAAHGFTPRGAWFAAARHSAALPEGVCAFAKGLQNLNESEPQSPMIFTTACDQMRRAADAASLSRNCPTFLFNLPATWQTLAARKLYRAEVDRLGKFLERHGGRAPTSAALAAIMREHDGKRQQLRRSIPQCPARQNAEAMASFWGATGEARLGFGVPPSGGPSATPPEGETPNLKVPLALVGGPLAATEWNLFDVVESAGGRIVLNATEPGERCLLPPLPQRLDDPLTALADYYFDNITDVFQRPNTRLYDWLRAALNERSVRGIVLWVHIGCDLWRAEAASLREAFGLPVLMLDAHEGAGGGLRDTNRLAAFVESLQ